MTQDSLNPQTGGTFLATQKSETELAKYFQDLLETQMKVPTNQAKVAAKVLAKQSINPTYQRTATDQHAVTSAWHWSVAKTRSVT